MIWCDEVVDYLTIIFFVTVFAPDLALTMYMPAGSEAAVSCWRPVVSNI